MTIVDLTPVEFFAIVIAANVHCALSVLAVWALRDVFKTGKTGERVMGAAGLAALIVLPVVAAYRAMA